MRPVHLSLAVALLFALAACMPAQQSATGTPASTSATNFLAPLPEGKPVTITFENYNLASAGIGREATLKMLDEFQQQHPNIKVEAKGTSSVDMFPAIQAQVAAGTPPDIAQLILREWDLNVENLPVKPLSDLIAPAEYEEHLKSTYPFHARAVALTERNGKQWGLSYVFSTPTLFYNADLFRAAGLDPSQPPRTWEEVKQAGKQIHERTGNGGLYIACIENDWCAQSILLSNGARVMSEDRSKVTFAEPPAIEVFRFWQSMVQEGAHVKMSEAEGQEAFAGGKIGMYLNTSAVQGTLLKAAAGKWELKATGMPAFGSKTVVPTNSGSALAILSNDPEKQRASWELMKFLTSEHAFQIITAEIGYLPLRTGIVNDDNYLKGWVAQNPQILPNIQQMDNLAPSLSYPGQNHLQIRKLYLTAFQQVIFEGADAQQTMRDTAARAQELMPR